MNDSMPITADLLRIVVDNDPAGPKPSSKPKPKRRFAQVDIERLRDPLFREGIGPAMRLYLLLQYVTRRGARAVRLTNEMAAEASLDRHQKSRHLARLEACGWIKVLRRGKRNPEVSLVLPIRRVSSPLSGP